MTLDTPGPTLPTHAAREAPGRRTAGQSRDPVASAPAVHPGDGPASVSWTLSRMPARMQG